MLTAAIAEPTNRSGITASGIVLEGISWETYERLLTGLGDSRLFVTYDDGTLEIQTLSPSYAHDRQAALLESLVSSICLDLDIPMRSGGSVTMRREDLRKGLEADGCFWLESQDALKGVIELNLNKHPVPDLVIEIDIHADSVDRLESYRKLRVPEVWWLRKHDGLAFLGLSPSGDYEERDASLNLPQVKRPIVAEALANHSDLHDGAWIKHTLAELGIR